MQLLDLTPSEIDFLMAPPAALDSLQTRLTRKLAATLTARLRLSVQAQAQPAAALTAVPVTPTWQPDAALATLWLTRRLGGQRVMGAISFVPRTLTHTLDAALAECWLDGAAQARLPPALAWQITAERMQATLAVQLPQHTIDMTRWARGVIQYG